MGTCDNSVNLNDWAHLGCVWGVKWRDGRYVGFRHFNNYGVCSLYRKGVCRRPMGLSLFIYSWLLGHAVFMSRYAYMRKTHNVFKRTNNYHNYDYGNKRVMLSPFSCLREGNHNNVTMHEIIFLSLFTVKYCKIDFPIRTELLYFFIPITYFLQ